MGHPDGRRPRTRTRACTRTHTRTPAHRHAHATAHTHTHPPRTRANTRARTRTRTCTFVGVVLLQCLSVLVVPGRDRRLRSCSSPGAKLQPSQNCSACGCVGGRGAANPQPKNIIFLGLVYTVLRRHSRKTKVDIHILQNEVTDS